MLVNKKTIAVFLTIMMILAFSNLPVLAAGQRQAETIRKPVLIETIRVPKSKTVIMDFNIGWNESVFIIGSEIKWTNFQDQTLQAFNAVVALSEGEWYGVTIIAGRNRDAVIEQYQLPSKEPGKHMNAILREHWIQKIWLTTAVYWGNNSRTPNQR